MTIPCLNVSPCLNHCLCFTKNIFQNNQPLKAKSWDLATDDHKGTSVPHQVIIPLMGILMGTGLPIEPGTQAFPHLCQIDSTPVVA